MLLFLHLNTAYSNTSYFPTEFKESVLNYIDEKDFVHLSDLMNYSPEVNGSGYINHVKISSLLLAKGLKCINMLAIGRYLDANMI